MMKITTLLLTVFLHSASSVAQNISGCLTNVDPDTDYFFTKVSPVASKQWSVDYYNTYKIVTNIAEGETYLLYQCGSQPPQNEVTSGNHSAIVQIPVSYVGIDITPAIPYLEQLGKVDSIVAYTSNASYVSSPCLLQSIEEGNVVVLQSKDALDEVFGSPEYSQELLSKLQNAIGFISPFNIAPPFNTSVKISEYAEKTNAGIFEWIKYYSVFFNLETKANEVFDLTEARWDCVAESANEVSQTDNPDKPFVLWAAYIPFCSGWDIGECPNYYCEYATECSATILESRIEGNFSEICQANYLSTEELVSVGRLADHFIYPAPDWNETYTLFKDQLDKIKAVQNKQVYDYQGSGANAWFEQRFAEYFAVLQDFCSVVGTVPTFAKRTYFRNTMDGSAIGSVGTQCTEDSRSNSILPVVGAVCDDLAPPKNTTMDTTNMTTNGTGGSKNNSTSGSSLAVMSITALLAVTTGFFV
jgi:ABC-type Fe3+-hydroxamate transport system substrate-binding protein